MKDYNMSESDASVMRTMPLMERLGNLGKQIDDLSEMISVLRAKLSPYTERLDRPVEANVVPAKSSTDSEAVNMITDLSNAISRIRVDVVDSIQRLQL